MPDIVLTTRIDNRLIHGQVATQWCGVVGANLLLVANDAVAGDEFRQGLMNMAAPAYAQTRYFSIEKTINISVKLAHSSTSPSSRNSTGCTKISRGWSSY